MKSIWHWLGRVAGILLLLGAVAPYAAAQDSAACISCHATLTQKAVVHSPAKKRCTACHADTDASVTPHKSRGKNAKGLALEPPALCLKCHEEELFAGKFSHAPVTAGLCLGCHNPHSSDHQGLLTKAPAALCLDCHPDVVKGPHVIAGFSRSGHPLGDEKKRVADPLRPGKAFYCASCHEPHRSEHPRLTRFEKGMAACQKCHRI